MPVVFLKQQQTRCEEVDAPLPTDMLHATAIVFRDCKLLQQVSNQSIHKVMAPLHELLRQDTMEMDQELSRSIPMCKGHDRIRCGACILQSII